MGYKKVCFDCRKAFSTFGVGVSKISLTCPECGKQTTLFNHKFRTPKKSDLKQWELVLFLRDNGFVYQHVYKEIENGVFQEVAYPKTMQEAESFVQKYKSQASTDRNIS